MRRLGVVTVSLALVFVFGARASPEGYCEREQTRLVVDNRSTQFANVDIWRHDGKQWAWRHVLGVGSGQWAPIYDVNQGERFRATLGNGVELYHTVNLQSGQDVWWLDK
jgi:hypothetical protein